MRLALPLLSLILLVGVACERRATPPAVERPPEVDAPVAVALEEPADEAGVNVIIAPSLAGQIDEALVLDAYRRAVAQGEQDFGLRPSRTVTIHIDPDRSIGLEKALGLASRRAIHLRAGQARRMSSLMPLMMHEYTHVLQYEAGRLRPQWWIEGQAEHEAQRVLDPAEAARARRALLRQLAGDVRAGKAPALASLRGSGGWDAYIAQSGAGRAYGWGHAAVAYIEDGWGFDAVAAVVRDADGPNTLGSFDAAVARLTGQDPAAFEAGLHAWLLKQG